MTNRIPPEARKRRPKHFLSLAPGTIAGIVADYIENKKYGKTYAPPVLNALSNFRDAIGRDPTFADFTAGNLTATVNCLRARSAKREYVIGTVSRLKRLWAWCAKQGYCEEPPPHCYPAGKPGNRNPGPRGDAAIQLSDAEGTLLHICKSLYFPRAIRITGQTTRSHYVYALHWFSKFLGRDPVLADLTDDNCIGMMQLMREKGRAPETINGSVGRIKTLWTWLAKRRVVDQFPTFQNVKEPKRIPRAWTRDELDRLLAACRASPRANWWTALHLVIWDTSERIGAVLSIRKEWLNWQTGDLLIPAEARKGKEADMSYRLHRDTLAVLARIRDNESELLFHPLPSDIYRSYRKIRLAAGVSVELRKTGFHRMRRSVASHLHAAGFNATDALGHASAEVTRKSYLDPAIAGAVRPADVLFRPGGEAIEVTVVPDEPLRIEYAPSDFDQEAAWL